MKTHSPSENLALDSNLHINSYKTLASLEQIRPAWERLQRHPNADLDFFLTILQVRPNVLRPHVVTLEQNGEIVAMLIGRLEQIELNCALGYKVLWHPRVRSISIVHGGILGSISKVQAELLAHALGESLLQGEADVITLSKLPVDHELFRIAQRYPGFLCRDLVTTAIPHWGIELPASLEELLQRFSSKRRNKFGRKERLFERTFPGQIRYRLIERPEDVPTLCQDLETVARLTYQRGLGAGFFNDKEHHRRLALAAARGQLCALVIYLNDRPCAFQLGTLYQGAYHLMHTGFDPALHQYEVGTLALTKMLDHLCRRGVQRYDFGLGDAEYKREFATTGWQEATVHMFAPRPRPVVINLTRELLATGALGLRKASATLGIAPIIKRAWRKYLSRAGNEPPKAA